MESCIYNGWVRHRRHEPSGHQFRYELFMMYLDLAELPQLFDPLLVLVDARPGARAFQTLRLSPDAQRRRRRRQ